MADATTVGTCAVCEREIAVRTDSAGPHLVHHGYQRPGVGYILGDCFAVGYAPHEITPVAAKMWREHCRSCKTASEAYLVRLQTGDVLMLYRPLKVPVPTTAYRPAFWSDDPGWTEWQEPFTDAETEPKRQLVFQELVLAAIRQTEHRIRFYGDEIMRMTRWIDAWEVKPLRDRPKVVPNPGRRRRRRTFGMGGAAR